MSGLSLRKALVGAALALTILASGSANAGPAIEPRGLYKSMTTLSGFVLDVAIVNADGDIKLPRMITAYVSNSGVGVQMIATCSDDGWSVVSGGGSNIPLSVSNPIGITTSPVSFVPKCRSFVVYNGTAGTMYISIIAEYD